MEKLTELDFKERLENVENALILARVDGSNAPPEGALKLMYQYAHGELTYVELEIKINEFLISHIPKEAYL